MADTAVVTNSKFAKREEIRKMSQDLKYLANEHRLAIILYLKSKKSASVGEISDNLSASFKATSKHLLFLVKKGILASRSDHPFVIYSLSTNTSDLIKKIIPLL